MFPSAGKKLNPAKGDLPYAFSALPQEAEANVVVPEHDSEPNTSSTCWKSAIKLFGDIIYYAGLLTCVTILLYRGYWFCVKLRFLPPMPILDYNSFTISNLNISNSNLEGNWDVKLTFGHSVNDYADVTYYNVLAGSIYYKQVQNVNLLAKVNPKSFYVQRKEIERVQLEFRNTGGEVEQQGQEQVIEEINKKVDNGVVNLFMEIVVETKFKKCGAILSGPDPYRAGTYCWDLMAKIDRVTGKGRLINAMPVYCH